MIDIIKVLPNSRFGWLPLHVFYIVPPKCLQVNWLFSYNPEETWTQQWDHFQSTWTNYRNCPVYKVLSVLTIPTTITSLLTVYHRVSTNHRYVTHDAKCIRSCNKAAYFNDIINETRRGHRQRLYRRFFISEASIVFDFMTAAAVGLNLFNRAGSWWHLARSIGTWYLDRNRHSIFLNVTLVRSRYPRPGRFKKWDTTKSRRERFLRTDRKFRERIAFRTRPRRDAAAPLNRRRPTDANNTEVKMLPTNSSKKKFCTRELNSEIVVVAK